MNQTKCFIIFSELLFCTKREMTSASQKSTAAAKTPCPLRHESTLAVVGAETFSKVSHSSRILMVGAGGIGCELLKNLVLAGFADIEVVRNKLDLSSLIALAIAFISQYV